MNNTDTDVVAEPSSATYGVRTGIQTGVSVSGLLGLLAAFNVWHPTAEQVLYLTPFLSAAGTVVWRLVENRVGKGLLRRV